LNSSEPVIRTVNLKKYFPVRGRIFDVIRRRPKLYVRAVDDITFDIYEREIFGLAGESGCGKSTLGGAILGILPRETKITGKAIFNGTDLISMPSKELRFIRGKDISMIFQDPMTSLNPVMKLRDHFLETIFTHTKTSKEDAIAMAEQALKEVGISSNRLNDYPFQLSGGMRQRVMIALSLVLGMLSNGFLALN